MLQEGQNALCQNVASHFHPGNRATDLFAHSDPLSHNEAGRCPSWLKPDQSSSPNNSSAFQFKNAANCISTQWWGGGDFQTLTTRLTQRHLLQVRLRCVQSACSIFQHPDRDVSTPFIHAVAPPVMNHLLALGSERPADDLELTLTLEGVRMVEILTAGADEINSTSLSSSLF